MSNWVACECEVCFCTGLAHSEFDGEDEPLCLACEMGEHEIDDDDPEA